MNTSFCSLDFRFCQSYKESQFFSVFNIKDKYLLTSSDNSVYIELYTREDIIEYIEEYIESIFIELFDDSDRYNTEFYVSINKNSIEFLHRLREINKNDSSENILEILKNISKKYLKLYLKINPTNNVKLFEILFKKNDIVTKLPIELINKIIKYV